MRRLEDLPDAWHRPLLRLAGLLAVTLLAHPSPVAGRSPELAETVPLNADLLVVELWDADLDIVVSTGTKPMLRTEAAAQGYSVEVDLRAAEVAASGVTTMHFRRAAGREGSRLRVEMAVDPGQQLRIAGARLDIALESGLEAPARVELAIEDSTATLGGLLDLRAQASGTSLRLAETGGALDLALTSGALEVLGHQGRLKLASTEADLELAGFEGDLEVDLEGGSLRMDGGVGAWVGQARDALLFFGGWQGKLELTAWDSTFEARGSPASAPAWKLSGAELTVILEETEGPLVIELVGGRLQARGVRGDGKTAVKLEEGAEARLAEVDGALALAVEDGAVEVDGVAQLELSASRSTVALAGVDDLRRLYLTDSTLTADLTATASAPGLLLAGQSEAEVSLATPCAVQLSASSTASKSQVEVTGCELRLPTKRRFKPFDQGSTFVLPVTLNAESVLRVEGRR